MYENIKMLYIFDDPFIYIHRFCLYRTVVIKIIDLNLWKSTHYAICIIHTAYCIKITIFITYFFVYRINMKWQKKIVRIFGCNRFDLMTLCFLFQLIRFPCFLFPFHSSFVSIYNFWVAAKRIDCAVFSKRSRFRFSSHKIHTSMRSRKSAAKWLCLPLYTFFRSSFGSFLPNILLHQQHKR